MTPKEVGKTFYRNENLFKAQTGVMTRTCYSSTQETDAGGLQVQESYGLRNKTLPQKEEKLKLVNKDNGKGSAEEGSPRGQFCTPSMPCVHAPWEEVTWSQGNPKGIPAVQKAPGLG